ncbi:MAG: YgeY family selenium metabolism-linked hydrolase [Candidatus Moduliflexus flocculans]|nr:YgeY family selenium metabolism-linked hydrolase [Candidatus Moduliflexus flocculans]
MSANKAYQARRDHVTQIVVDEMHALGFDKVWVDENGSAIGVVEGMQPGKTVLFDAHTDTVGIAPGSVWTKDPFGGEIIDGYLYGRGSADMKGALAAMVHAAANVDKGKLAGRVVVSASVLEEVYEGGALKTVMDAVNPDFVVIGESSDLNLVHGGRGRAEIHLETIGKPSHSSSPQLGVNAVHLMMKVIEAVEKLKLGEHPLLGPAILALTDIISEPYPGYSVIPSRCKATYDRRLLTGETVEEVLGAINSLPELKDIPFKAVIAEGEHQACTGNTLTCTKFFPAWELDAGHPFVQTALKGLRAAGLNPTLSAYRFCTNAAYSMGQAGVPTIGFGPGTEADAHVVDERLSLESLEKAAEGYRGIIQAVLG